jgi:transposase
VKRLRQEFREVIVSLDVSRMRFVDESNAQINMTRRYGWAATHERVVDNVPETYGDNLTTVAAIGLSGVLAPAIFEGAMDGACFHAYVAQQLAPALEPGDIVVLDNLSAHKVNGVVELIQARGARVVFLPPYSPDCNPIELCWSKIKTALRRAKARTVDALIDALAHALRSVSLDDILHWFAHCGYHVAA